MKPLYFKGYKWLLSENQQELTFWVIDGTRLWLSISNLFFRKKKKKIKIKGRLCLECMLFKSSSARSITCSISVLQLLYVSVYNTVPIPVSLTWSKLPLIKYNPFMELTQAY